ncbi:hypothetical protein KDAU_34890 [Dictyobacter aurantiacus]|uniref:Uncharacterized protein n=1 Tax=Dictyobacter aurantiacus TaxID=1936993 RepID=A0A401ZGZ7_9CHLR|nr:hypothetical protein KDAU_34890 [Dictyobacter aurantiacus]
MFRCASKLFNACGSRKARLIERNRVEFTALGPRTRPPKTGGSPSPPILLYRAACGAANVNEPRLANPPTITATITTTNAVTVNAVRPFKHKHTFKGTLLM